MGEAALLELVEVQIQPGVGVYSWLFTPTLYLKFICCPRADGWIVECYLEGAHQWCTAIMIQA